MGKQKLFRVQAMNEKGMMLDVEIMGHKAHGIAMQEALGMCQAQGKGLIRSQMDGARGWAVYVYDAANDARYAHQVYKDEAAEHSARFDRWKACGGAGWGSPCGGGRRSGVSACSASAPCAHRWLLSSCQGRGGA